LLQYAHDPGVSYQLEHRAPVALGTLLFRVAKKNLVGLLDESKLTIVDITNLRDSLTCSHLAAHVTHFCVLSLRRCGVVPLHFASFVCY
jgi:hypothetical protein